MRIYNSLVQKSVNFTDILHVFAFNRDVAVAGFVWPPHWGHLSGQRQFAFTNVNVLHEIVYSSNMLSGYLHYFIPVCFRNFRTDSLFGSMGGIYEAMYRRTQ